MARSPTQELLGVFQLAKGLAEGACILAGQRTRPTDAQVGELFEGANRSVGALGGGDPLVVTDRRLEVVQLPIGGSHRSAEGRRAPPHFGHRADERLQLREQFLALPSVCHARGALDLLGPDDDLEVGDGRLSPHTIRGGDQGKSGVAVTLIRAPRVRCPMILEHALASERHRVAEGRAGQHPLVERASEGLGGSIVDCPPGGHNGAGPHGDELGPEVRRQLVERREQRRLAPGLPEMAAVDEDEIRHVAHLHRIGRGEEDAVVEDQPAHGGLAGRGGELKDAVRGKMHDPPRLRIER